MLSVNRQSMNALEYRIEIQLTNGKTRQGFAESFPEPSAQKKAKKVWARRTNVMQCTAWPIV